MMKKNENFIYLSVAVIKVAQIRQDLALDGENWVSGKPRIIFVKFGLTKKLIYGNII